MKKLILFLFSFTFIFAEEEVQVALKTKNPLFPVYFFLVKSKEKGEESFYLDKIKQVFYFDLDNSGYTTVASSEASKDKLLTYPDLKVCFDSEFWQKQKIRLVIKITATPKKLNVFIYDAIKESFDLFSTIDLLGDLNKDRRQIHELTDNILAKYFQKKGIAQTKIIYTIRKDNPNNEQFKWLSEVWMCDWDGENKSRLTFENSYCVTPVFLKGSSNFEFLYVSYKNGLPKICLCAEEKKGELIALRGNQLLPSISKNFDKVAFISDVAGRPDLFLQRIDKNKNPVGKPWQLFSAPRATQASSSFSPDGKKLVFVSDKDGSPRLYVLQIPENTSNNKRPYAHLITKKNRYNVTPAWSNDGKKIVYSAKTDRIRQIWLYDFETDEEIQLTTGKENKENPCWAEDDLHIVYNTEEKSLSELYIINLNKLNPVKITTGEGQKRFPAWVR